jgi:hypothetical protein
MPGTEALTPKRAEQALTAKGVAAKDGPAMVQIVEDADLTKIPADAISLATWLARAHAVLPPLVVNRSAP